SISCSPVSRWCARRWPAVSASCPPSPPASARRRSRPWPIMSPRSPAPGTSPAPALPPPNASDGCPGGPACRRQRHPGFQEALVVLVEHRPPLEGVEAVARMQPLIVAPDRRLELLAGGDRRAGQLARMKHVALLCS